MDNPKETQDTKTSEKPAVTSKETPTYTEESQVKAVSDALATAGRNAKALQQKEEKAEKALAEARKVADEVERKRNEWLEEQDQQELAAAQGDATATSEVRVRQRMRAREAALLKKERELAEKDSEHKTQLEEIARYNQQKDAEGIGAQHGVDGAKLLRLTDGSTEKMEELARELSVKGPVTQTPDTGMTKGGGGELTIEQIRLMSPEERAARAAEIAELPLGIK